MSNGPIFYFLYCTLSPDRNILLPLRPPRRRPRFELSLEWVPQGLFGLSHTGSDQSHCGGAHRQVGQLIMVMETWIF